MDMRKMMKEARKMQAQLDQAQEEAREMEFSAKAGGGAVEAVAKGDMTLKSLWIDPEVIDPEDPEMLADLVLAAVNEALRGVNEQVSTHINQVAGGVNVPGF